jgi:isopentenyl-diphosphate Delta-isomerase
VRETPDLFESRKKDHIRIALKEESQSLSLSQFDRIQLSHEALPEIDFDEINLETPFFSYKAKSPLFISSMTAGFENAVLINSQLAKAAEHFGWVMGVGSQRKELADSAASNEWQIVKRVAPRAQFLANIGLAQLIQSSTDEIKKLTDNLEALALIVHLNPLQEVLQKEGTPQFKGGLAAIERIVKELNLPVIIKETGCGFSRQTITRLKDTGIAAIDIAGGGGTHWGRVEGYRALPGELQYEAAQSFANWGFSTIESLNFATEINPKFEIWGSGGVRSGLDAAKLIAMGAQKVGVAMPMMKAALIGEAALHQLIEKFEFELKTALFCTGRKTPMQLTQSRSWQWK